MNILNFFSFAQGLASVQRFSSHRLANRESVLEHTGFVAIMALIVGLELDLGSVEMLGLMVRATVHDWEEERTGDILRPVKHSSPEMLAIFDKLKATAIDQVFTSLAMTKTATNYLSATHDHAKDGKIGFIVDLCDKAAVVYKVYDEVLLRNNLTMVPQAKRNRDNINVMRGKLHGSRDMFSAQQYGYLDNLMIDLIDVCNDAAALDRANTGTGTVS